MNDYDDPEEYSSANSFRARSNTWPLNRPDLAVPNNVCIDETLPEIDLEEDDLFTTNDNWTSGIVDHDIMSWDPILNAQNHTQFLNNYQHVPPNTATTIHHHHQPQPQPQPQQQQQNNTQASQAHQQQTLHQHLQQQPHNSPLNASNIIQLHHPSSHPPQLQPQHHQTLNDSRCLESDDHIHQLHHLRLDGGQAATEQQQQQQSPYISAISSSPVCIHSSPTALGSDNYHITPEQQHHPSQHHQNLQQLAPARYDLEQQAGDYDLKLHQPTQHPTLHHLTSSSLDQHSPSANMLSSSLGTSGIGLGSGLEDLDFKIIEGPSMIQNLGYKDGTSDQRQSLSKAEGQIGEVSDTTAKQQNSTTSSKTKLNTPRRNAWGNLSYADLISQAINSTNDKRLTLSEIYDWMVQHVPYFKDKGDSTSSAGWKNSVRHNLSLHSRFKRLQNEGTGKSSWWTINPEANVGKCARRRAASMEASKFEKKRGRAKKRAEAIRQGLISNPSLTGSSLNGSTGNLNQSRIELSPEQFGSQQDQVNLSSGVSTENLRNLQQQNQNMYQQVSTVQQQNSAAQQYDSNTNSDENLQLQPQQLQPQPQPNIPPTATTPPSQHHQQSEDQRPIQHHINHKLQQVHHQLHKIESLDNGFYYIQQDNHDGHQLQQHEQIHSQHQIMNVPASDLFGRHTIYMSEPCNDCNCADLVNYGTNAMSFT